MRCLAWQECGDRNIDRSVERVTRSRQVPLATSYSGLVEDTSLRGRPDAELKQSWDVGFAWRSVSAAQCTLRGGRQQPFADELQRPRLPGHVGTIMCHQPTYDREVFMTGGERLVYRLLIGAVVLTSVVAALATFLASSYDSVWGSLNAIVDGVSMIPAHYWASGSDFPDLRDLFLLSLAGFSGVRCRARYSLLDPYRHGVGGTCQLRAQA